VAALVESAGRMAQAAPLQDAAKRCLRIADIEVEAMGKLVTL
jgi:hypothetical protein